MTPAKLRRLKLLFPEGFVIGYLNDEMRMKIHSFNPNADPEIELINFMGSRSQNAENN